MYVFFIMYGWMDVCMYVCMDVCVYMYVYIYIYIYTYVKNTHVHMYPCLCMYACLFVMLKFRYTHTLEKQVVGVFVGWTRDLLRN